MSGARCVLVVDDDASTRELVRLVLTDEGYCVLEAAEGESALQFVRVDPPSLILLDLIMPSMDGWQFIEAYYRQASVPAPIVLTTAVNPALADIQPGWISGILPKPFDIEDLLAMVRRHAPRPPSVKIPAARGYACYSSPTAGTPSIGIETATSVGSQDSALGELP